MLRRLESQVRQDTQPDETYMFKEIKEEPNDLDLNGII